MSKNIDLHKFLVTGKKDTGGRNRGLISTKRRKDKVFFYMDFNLTPSKEDQELEFLISQLSNPPVKNNQIPQNLKEAGNILKSATGKLNHGPSTMKKKAQKSTQITRPKTKCKK